MSFGLTTRTRLTGNAQGSMVRAWLPHSVIRSIQRGTVNITGGTTGTTIHATGTSATVVDRVYMFAYNGHTADVLLTVEFGGVTVPDQNIVVTVPFKSGLMLIVDGLPLLGSGSVALTISAFAATANVITLSGYILRIVP